jgi:hypothetical protein
MYVLRPVNGYAELKIDGHTQMGALVDWLGAEWPDDARKREAEAV